MDAILPIQADSRLEDETKPTAPLDPALAPPSPMTTPRRPRITIGSLMVGISGFALFFAIGRWSVAAACLLAWPLLFWGAARLVAWGVRTTPLRAGVWLAAAYPWFARVVVGSGRILQSTLSSTLGVDPVAQLTMSEVFFGVLWLVWLGPVLIFVEVLLTLARGEPSQKRQVARLILIPVASWVSFFAGCANLLMALIDGSILR